TGLWYTKDYGFELNGFSDADYAGFKDTFKSTFSGAQFLGEKLGTNLHAFVKKKVGDEEQTLFWEDSWLSDPPLKNIFPRLYALEINKHASVAAKFRDTSMSASFKRVPRGGLEEDQFELLSNKVVPVILFSIKDRWVWILDSGGELSL
nr:RNA-directed DNA polymerase, eukaryota, reverse transcriptase zinc-binding domain protein [Tanacetum cinerariifolium]